MQKSLWLQLGIIAIGVWYFIGLYRIDGTSMNYGLIENDIVIVRKHFFAIHRGDLVVIRHPLDVEKRLYIKRCVAVGKDRFFEKERLFYLQLEGNSTQTKSYALRYHLHTQQTPLGYFLKAPYENYYPIVHNTYLQVPPPLEHLPLTTIPQGYFYTLGDYRDNSADSRFYGAVPRAWIVAKVIAIFKIPRPWKSLLEIPEAD